MNIAELERKLLAAARAAAPSDAAPYAFEQRILARLEPPARPEAWGWWAGALWRAALPSLAVVLVLGLCVAALGFFGVGADSLNSDLESTMFASLDASADAW